VSSCFVFRFSQSGIKADHPAVFQTAMKSCAGNKNLSSAQRSASPFLFLSFAMLQLFGLQQIPVTSCAGLERHKMMPVRFI